jgi:hypothetical protein
MPGPADGVPTDVKLAPAQATGAKVFPKQLLLLSCPNNSRLSRTFFLALMGHLRAGLSRRGLEQRGDGRCTARGKGIILPTVRKVRVGTGEFANVCAASPSDATQRFPVSSTSDDKDLINVRFGSQLAVILRQGVKTCNLLAGGVVQCQIFGVYILGR